MNAPTTTAQLDAEHANIDLQLLIPSPTNPRKRKGFDDKSLSELADSIRSIGIAQPILVRVALQDDGTGTVENKGNYEIVAGERRWRAAKIAGLAEVPCIIRNLDDLDVLKIQLVENKQREDLDELEEAEGYEKLLQQTDSDGNKYTVETIAKSMGVSKGTIYARMKLLDLCQDARQAFYDGKLDASTALLIARIPVEKLQLQALKKVTEELGWGNQFTARGDKMSYRRAKELMREEFMLHLNRAAFDPADHKLLPAAGSCTDCPKRTGNAADLFEDVDDANVCTDTVCFGMKKAAHVLQLQKAAENEGAVVLKGKAAKKLIGDRYTSTETQLHNNGYVSLDERVPGDELNRTYGQILTQQNLMKPTLATGKPVVQKTVIANPQREGQMIEAVSIEAATKALREAGFEITLKGAPNKPPLLAKAEEEEKKKAQLAIENTFRSRLYDALHTRIEADTLDPSSPTWPMLFRRTAQELLNFVGLSAEDMKVLIQKYTPIPAVPDGEEIDWEFHFDNFSTRLADLTPAQHLTLIVELILISQDLTTGWHNSSPETMLTIAKEVDIDAGAIRKQVEAEAKAAQKEAAAAKKAAEKDAGKPAAKKAKKGAKGLADLTDGEAA